MMDEDKSGADVGTHQRSIRKPIRVPAIRAYVQK